MDKIKSLVAISRPFFALLLHLKKCRMLSRTAFAQMAFVIMHKEELVRILPLPDLLRARGKLPFPSSFQRKELHYDHNFLLLHTFLFLFFSISCHIQKCLLKHLLHQLSQLCPLCPHWTETEWLGSLTILKVWPHLNAGNAQLFNFCLQK